MSDAPSNPLHFPFSAMVGADELRLALVLCAIDPGIGGVLLRGDKGSGKTTLARGLAALLPEGATFVELPLGATEDRVVGSLDLEAAFAGSYETRSGLLADADGGVLYVDEVNLLADHLVDLLLDAAATGTVRIERDGVSVARRSRFVLVGSMNPEEGELRPQLLDRFGLSAAAGSLVDPEQRAEAVRRRLRFDADPEVFAVEWADEEASLRDRLAVARPSPLAEGLHAQVSRLCVAAGAEGLRADLVICRAAAALAGWEGAPEARAEHVRRVMGLALAHRRHHPFDQRPSDRTGGTPDARSFGDRSLDELADQALGESGRGGRGPAEGNAGSSSGGDGHDGDYGPSPWAGSSGAPSGGLLARLPDGSVPPRRTPVTPPGSSRHPGAGAPAAGGRMVGSFPLGAEPASGGIAPVPTVMAAVERRAAEGTGTGTGRDVAEPWRIQSQDLRLARRERPLGRLLVIAVDTSGSMGADERVSLVREAVLALLVDAYQLRDRVAIVTFAGERADMVLRPTGSTEVARARLTTVATGGRTPLASGIDLARTVAIEGRRAGYRPVLAVVSDGRATWVEEGDPLEASLAAGAAVRAEGIDAVVIDCEGQRNRLGLAEPLAEAMGATVIAAAELSGAGLALALSEL